MRRIVGNFVALITALVVAGLVGEGAARLLTPAPLTRREPQVRYDPDSVRTFTLRPNQTAYTLSAAVHIDSNGFRTNGEPPAGDSAATLLALGDSFTFGLGVADSATWPAQLERDLRAHAARPVQVVNMGTVSYGEFQEMDLLRRKGLALHPAVIIHALYWNDYMSAHRPQPGAPPVLTPGGEFVWDVSPPAHSLLARVKRFVVAHSRLAQVAGRVIRGDENTGDYGHAYAHLVAGQLDSANWQPLVSFYTDLRRVADSVGARLFVVIMPVNGIMAAHDPRAQAYPDFARRLLQHDGIPAVDGFAVLKAHHVSVRDAFLPQGPDSHLAPLGYRLIARALADSLVADPASATVLGFAIH